MPCLAWGSTDRCIADTKRRCALRTTIAARANKRGEAIVTLDVSASAEWGGYKAVLEPYRPISDGWYPEVASFEINQPISPEGHQYAVTDNVHLRSEPASQSESLGVIPSGTQVSVECTVLGELIQGPQGNTTKWDRVTWDGNTGYVTDAYVGIDVDVRRRRSLSVRSRNQPRLERATSVTSSERC